MFSIIFENHYFQLVESNGIAILGQDQDNFGGGFDRFGSFARSQNISNIIIVDGSHFLDTSHSLIFGTLLWRILQLRIWLSAEQIIGEMFGHQKLRTLVLVKSISR